MGSMAWRRSFECLLHYLPPKKYVVEVPLCATQIPCGMVWKVKEVDHTIYVYGYKPEPVKIDSQAPIPSQVSHLRNSYDTPHCGVSQILHENSARPLE